MVRRREDSAACIATVLDVRTLGAGAAKARTHADHSSSFVVCGAGNALEQEFWISRRDADSPSLLLLPACFTLHTHSFCQSPRTPSHHTALAAAQNRSYLSRWPPWAVNPFLGCLVLNGAVFAVQVHVCLFASVAVVVVSSCHIFSLVPATDDFLFASV